MASDADADGDEDVLLLVHQLPLDMDGGHVRRIANILPPLHPGDSPPPPGPFRPPPPLQAAASAEPRLSFRGWLGAPRHWDLWVAKLRPIHAGLWRRLGIHDAVLASTFRFRRDASALLHLASFWCPHTNTFAFPWGEATVTLHDVAVLAGLPAAGAPVSAPLAADWRPDEAALNGVRLGFNRSACKKAHHSAWIKYFLTDHVSDVPLEHEHAAFLALWLTRFVLPGHPESTMRQSLFPIAVRLARGERVALGPAVLASLYRDLRDIKAFLVATAGAATNGNADMLSSLSLYSPLHILQLWMWEHFPALRPGKDKPLKDGEPMSGRWHDLSRKINPTLIREALSSADNFLWQPYPCSLHTTGWVRGSNHAENDDLRSLAHCLRPCELVGMDCIEQYLPHRVARQFGLDQDVPGDVPRANQNWAVAWQSYELGGKNVAFFIPQIKPGVTARYAHWWRKQLPHSDLHAGPPSVPMERKTSKRKVKKTLVAMEAEAEKEQRLKKARVSPVSSDKKRKLEELYDSDLSDWLTAARNEIGDAAGGSYERGASLPKYDTASDEALLPNVGPTNDDVVLLVPRKQTTSPAVMPMTDSSINPAIGDRGTFIADILYEPEGVTTAMLQDEKLMIPADTFSLDVTDSPERPTMAMESGNEASGASDTPEEVTAPITEEKEEKFVIGETSCVAGMNPSEKNIAVVMEANEVNAVYEEVGRAAKEAIEVALEGQQEVDGGVMNYSHVAVVLPEEALPIHHTRNSSGYSKVSCTMEDSNVSGGLSTNDGETTCHGFVVEEQRDLRSVEVIGGGDDHQIALEKEFDMDLVTDSKNSTDDERPCSLATVQLKGDQVGVSHQDRMQEQHVQNVELIDQMEPSSDAASIKEAILEQEQDFKTRCNNNRETTTLESSLMMDSGVKSDLVTLEVDATVAAGGIQNQKIFDADKQLAIEERQDLGIIVENNKMDSPKGGDNMVCDEHQINLTTIEVNEVESPIGIQNQEFIDNEEQLAMEERQDRGTTIEKNKMNTLDVADILVCGEHEIDPTGTEVNEIESTKGMQNQEPSSDKGTRADRQHHGVENVNKKWILQDASMTGSGELNSEATILDVNMAGSRKETLNQCALGTEKEAVMPEAEDKGTADRNTERDSADTDTLQCGMKLDEAVNMARDTLLTAQDIDIEEFVISSKNKQMEAPLGKQNMTEAEGSESNKTVVKEPEKALPPKPEIPAEVKQENVENETEMSICRDNDEEPETYQTSAEVSITPNLEEHGENDNGLAEDLVSNPENSTCHYPLKCGKSSIEEVKRTYSTRYMYLKDIEESLGRIRAEPVNRVKPTNIGNYSRHADQEPISVCKDIKVPLCDSSRDFGRDRVPELVLTSPPEETS